MKQLKQLQNNFTTPEQSKRLLELGVPAWTADCYYYEEGGISENSTPNIVSLGEVWTDESKETMFSSFVDIPCWSVGRLIEIYVYLIPHEYVSLIFNKTFTPIDKILDKLEKSITNGTLDFSKLEDELL